MGFHYELVKSFCDYIGVDIHLVIEKDFEKGFELLKNGGGDIAAHSLTITVERLEMVNFTDPLIEVRQMLVQRKPDDWRNMKSHQIEEALVKRPSELDGKEIHVKRGSSYAQRLRNLADETGVDFMVVEEFGDISTEDLINMVANGEINYTVADEDIASILDTYLPDIDCNTPLSLPTQVAWATRKNSTELINAIDTWLLTMKRKPDFNILVKRYFEDTKGFNHRAKSDYFSIKGSSISPYDHLIKKYAKKIGWDWRLLAGLIYQESAFDPKATSWVGAKGLMQLMPVTADEFGATDPEDPETSIKAGTNYLAWIEKYWEDDIQDKEELIKFVLATYNAGQGHIADARSLTEKYDRDPNKWDDNVAYYLLQKQQPKFYNDPVVKYGYCRGVETIQYVNEVLNHYKIYKQLISTEEEI